MADKGGKPIGKSDKAEFTKAPVLADKVPPIGGLSADEAVKRAEKAVADVAKEFEGMLGEELDEIDVLMAAYKADPTKENLDPLFGRIHNLRGQGTTLGYPLITRIGTSFCRYIIDRNPAKPVKAPLIEQHLQALRIVLKERKESEGDALSKQVAEALETAVDKELA